MDQLLGPEDPSAANAKETTETAEQVWPYIPADFEPPPSHLVDAVKEG